MSANPLTPAARPSMPASYSAQWAQGSLTMNRRWSRPVGTLMCLTAVPGAFMVLAAPTHVLGLVGLIWGGIANLVNRTEIYIGSGELWVHHRPIPWFGQVHCAVDNIDHFFVRSHCYGQTETYSVHVSRKRGGALRLVTGFTSENEAERATETFASLVGNTALALPPVA